MAADRAEIEKWFEAVWADREERVYRDYFGDIGTSLMNLPRQLFAELGVAEVDPRWLTHGVFESPPNEGRSSWLYVTTGLSNPWGEGPGTATGEGWSGLGFEFVMQTPERALWAAGVLNWLMAVQILVATGHFGGDLVDLFDRVPLGVSIDPKRESVLRNLVVAEPVEFPKTFQLASGRVDLLLCVGISDAEREFGRTQGGPALVEMLARRGAFPVTDAGRESVIPG